MHVVVQEFGAAEADKTPVDAGERVALAQERSFQERRPRLAAGPSEIAILDGDWRIVEVNQAWRNTANASGLALRDAGVGASYVDVAGRFLPDLDRSALEFNLRRLASGKGDHVQHTYPVPTSAGLRWRHVQVSPLAKGSGRLVAIHDDLTELATAQEALKMTYEEVLHARDDERQRIAVELHDSTCQHLAAISLSLAQLRRAARAGSQVSAIVDDIAGSLNEAAKETRVLSYLMKPRGLGEEGLSAAVLHFLEGFARRTGLEVSLEANGPVDAAPAQLQHAALRIVQEALLNANRHAQARRVAVELAVDEGLLKISIADDGRGMRPGKGEPNLGVGIPGMAARAQQFSGELAISSDESGTRVVALLPLPTPPADEGATPA